MEPCSSVQIRHGTPADASAFADLVIIADQDGPHLYFGKFAHQMMQRLYIIPNTLYSYDKAHFLEADGQVAGMMLGYTAARYRADKWRTYRLMSAILKWRSLRLWAMSVYT